MVIKFNKLNNYNISKSIFEIFVIKFSDKIHIFSDQNLFSLTKICIL